MTWWLGAIIVGTFIVGLLGEVPMTDSAGVLLIALAVGILAGLLWALVADWRYKRR